MSAVGSVDQSLLVTAEGYEQLCSELETLRSEGRRAVSEHLRETRADGDFNSNPALFDAIDDQTLLERRIADLEAQVAAARVVAPAADGKAGIGSFVRVRDLESEEVAEYELVGALESDIAKGRMSVVAPVGRALLGRSAGDAVVVDTPSGPLTFEILRVAPVAGGQATVRKAA
jgi:transcription elongation factor GreA